MPERADIKKILIIGSEGVMATMRFPFLGTHARNVSFRAKRLAFFFVPLFRDVQPRREETAF